MDRRVKERLVGASILVVLIVLIVPALLSGPAPGPAPAPATPGLPVTVSTPEPIRNVTVDLATSKPPAPEPVAEAAAAPAASLASVASAASSAQPPQGRNDEPASAVAPSAAAASAPLETASPPPTSNVSAGKPAMAGRAWTVQLGSFASHDNAEKMLRQLRAQGFAAFVSPSGAGPSLRYRVRIGPMADRGAAAQAVAKLKGLGHTASIVAPAS
jgi:DedD protein